MREGLLLFGLRQKLLRVITADVCKLDATMANLQATRSGLFLLRFKKAAIYILCIYERNT